MKKIEKLLQEQNVLREELKIPHAAIVESITPPFWYVRFYNDEMSWENAVEVSEAIIRLDQEFTEGK